MVESRRATARRRRHSIHCHQPTTHYFPLKAERIPLPPCRACHLSTANYHPPTTIASHKSISRKPSIHHSAIFLPHSRFFLPHSSSFPLHSSFFILHPPVRGPLPARSPLACSNISCARPAFCRGFRAREKTLKKLRRPPLRPEGRFGILLTRCAAQGETPAGRGTDL